MGFELRRCSQHCPVWRAIPRGSNLCRPPCFPPHFEKVPDLMDRFFSMIHENWTIVDHPTWIAGYALWRLNWIHPFVEGNGRTARAACYYLICLKQGKLLPGKKIVPERIREDRKPYYAALQAADKAWDQGKLDVSEIAKYLERLLTGQLTERQVACSNGIRVAECIPSPFPT